MANNPYSPPTAEVAKPDVPVTPGPMPRTVKIGLPILLMLQFYGLYRTNLWARLQNDDGTVPLWLLVTPILGPQLITLTAVILTFLRKNWARFVLLLVAIVGLLATAASDWAISRWVLKGRTVEPSLVANIIFFSMLILRVVGTGLLFTPSANAWFRPRAGH